MRSIYALIRSFFKKLYLLIKGKKPSIDPEIPDEGFDDIVVYYGCPNSKKAKKLQLEKSLYK